MGEGLSYESFAGKLSVVRTTLYNWEKSYPDFLYSKKIGEEKKLLFFEKQGLDAINGKIKGFSASTYIFTMKNKCGWTDQIETSTKTESKINISVDDKDL